VITEEAARRAAEEALREFSAEPGVPQLEITRTEERPVGWVYFYQSARYLQKFAAGTHTCEMCR